MNGEGLFLHAALLAKTMELMRNESNSDNDFLPVAMRFIWGNENEDHRILEAKNAPNPIVASRLIEPLLIELGTQER
jgi:hypothetical protein